MSTSKKETKMKQQQRKGIYQNPSPPGQFNWQISQPTLCKVLFKRKKQNPKQKGIASAPKSYNQVKGYNIKNIYTRNIMKEQS